jgi:hypothetical protein
MKRHLTRFGVCALLLLIAACDPNGRRPGLWLSGDEVAAASDWSFTEQIPEIAIQVHTPYLLPHSVTIWCSSVDGKLFVGASAPETKRWPGWVDDDPNVKLKIDGKVYAARLKPLTTPEEMAPVQSAFAMKYKLGSSPPSGEGPRSARLWAVEFVKGSSS